MGLDAALNLESRAGECRGEAIGPRSDRLRGRLGVRGFGTRADIGRVPISRQSGEDVTASRMCAAPRVSQTNGAAGDSS